MLDRDVLDQSPHKDQCRAPVITGINSRFSKMLLDSCVISQKGCYSRILQLHGVGCYKDSLYNLSNVQWNFVTSAIMWGTIFHLVSCHHNHFHICVHSCLQTGARGSVVVKALCYKPEGRGFETRWDEWFLSIYLTLPVALGPGVYSASNRNEYQKHKNNVTGE
jgi:hypothetical protein